MRPYALILIFTTALMFLLGCRAQPDSPLAAAAARGDSSAVEDLLNRGAAVDPADTCMTPLIQAARGGYIATMAVLLRHGADPNWHGGRNDWTPLMHAIHKGQKQSVLVLLAGGADINAKTRSGLTALMMAAGYGYADIVRILLAKGADPYLQDAHGGTALTLAVGGVPDIDRFTVGSCQTETVQALLETAPDLRLKDDFRGRTARWSAQWGRCSEVLGLLERASVLQSAR